MRFSFHQTTRFAAALILMILCVSPCAWSWGRIGHWVSAQIAESHLNPDALAAVHEILGPGVRLADVADWADSHRNSSSGAWHYVNVPIADARYDSKYCPPGGCVVSKIEEFRQVLIDPRAGQADKRQALMYLIHFIVDLHQPMHVGDHHDHGGNLTQVRFFGRGSNLHRVWDSQIIEHISGDEQTWFRHAARLITAENKIAWSTGAPELWATESLQAVKECYFIPGTKTVMRSGTKLGSEYCRWATPVIESQLAKAGIRLAFALNDVFRPSMTNQPARTSSMQQETARLATGIAGETIYHGNTKSRVFHSPACKNYNCKNCTREFRSIEDALAAGFRPCGMCKP